ncbi:MAG: PAS domain-containing protein [Bacteroidales bacterium]|nr:PAS domain-containing protein [Bacteroidales bacterium]
MSDLNYLPTILIVDDKRENINLLTSILKKTNVNIIQAISGQEALKNSSGIELALAIVDVRMPVMSGFEMAVKLNEHRAENKVPVIFLTANHHDQEEELRGYSSGAADYLLKPFSKQILLSKVAVFLDLFRQKQTILRNALLLSKSLENLAKANEQLAEREQKYLKEQLFNKALLDSIPGIFYLYSYPELRMVAWNKQHETLFGFKPEEMKGRHVLEWHLPENHQAVLNSLDDFMETGRVGIEARLLAKDGHSIPFLLTAINFESQGQNYLIGIGTDVSEQKQAEEALRASKTILTKAQQIAHVGSWEYDYGSDKMKCSDETFRIFGFQPGAIEPTLDLFYSMVHKDDYPLLVNSIEDAKNKHIPLNIDLRIIYPNGEQRFIHEQAEMTFDSKGEPVKWIGTVHDITQRKKTEEELQKSLEQLHQLSKHIEQARENERLNIARELHDDLGQALTAVKIDLEIIKQSTSEESVKEKLEDAKTLVGSTIRTVQRITAQLRPEIIDDLGLEAAIDWYTKEFSKRYGIAVFLDIENGIPILNDEALPLFRIMQESLTNIARHSGATHIEISLNRHDDLIHFVVSDNGVGITNDQINAKKSFGIMSMKERASALGGSFEIKNGEGFGCKIMITFPIKTDRL